MRPARPPLCTVTPDKQEEDEHLQTGPFAGMFAYYDESRKSELEVSVKPGTGQLHYSQSHGNVHDGRYMYAVSKDFQVYISKNTPIHSQFCAGAPVRCAGWLMVSNGIITNIDNCSGHYTPSASQFLYTCYRLVLKGYLSLEASSLQFSQLSKYDVTTYFSTYKKLAGVTKLAITNNKQVDTWLLMTPLLSFSRHSLFPYKDFKHDESPSNNHHKTAKRRTPSPDTITSAALLTNRPESALTTPDMLTPAAATTVMMDTP